ncbi:MAG: LysR family transcriptional regulator [Nannocystales bacterium]
MQVRWFELELVAAIGSAGSATAAAPLLGVSQSTVSRRLAELEARLGTKLFDRQGQCLVATPEGAEVVAASESVESTMNAALRRVVGRDRNPGGLVRITALASIHELLMATYATALEKNPELELELDSKLELLSLHRGEAEIALRITASPPEGLVGRRIARFAYGLYRRRDAPTPSDVIGFPPPRGDLAKQEWLRALVPEPRLRVRVESDRAQVEAVRSGLGIAQLPCLFGDGLPDLERVPGAPLEWGDWLWVLTHPSLREVARVRVLLDLLYETLERMRPRLEGEEPALP